MPNLITKLTLDKGNFDRNIAGATKKVRDMDRQFKDMGKGLNSFGGGLGLNVGALGSFASAIGVAALAGQGLKKVLESNQITGDALASTLSVVTDVTNNFAVALGTADFSAFNNGLGEMIAKSKAAYAAMDQLGNTAMSFGYFSNKNAAEVRQLNLDVKDALANGDIKTAVAAYDKAVGIVNQQATDAVNARKRVDEAVTASIAAASTLYAGDISREDIEEALRVDLMGNPASVRAKMSEQYDEYVKARRQILEEKGKRGFNWASLLNTNVFLGGIAQLAGIDTNTITSLSTEESDKLQRALDVQNKKLVVAKTILQNYTDEQLKTLIDQLNMADSYDQSTAALEKQTQAMRKAIDAAKQKNNVEAKDVNRGKGEYMVGKGIKALGTMSTPENAVPVFTSTVDPAADALREFNRQIYAMEAAQSIIGSIGDAMRSLTGDTKAARAATAALVVVTEALAVAEAIKTAGASGDPYTVAVRIAAAAAACVGAFASIGFAEGGIIPGSGGRKSDKVNVRASAGEMILNGQQQANLWHIIQSGSTGNNGSNVEFVIKGSQLVGVLSNYNNKRGRTL